MFFADDAFGNAQRDELHSQPSRNDCADSADALARRNQT